MLKSLSVEVSVCACLSVCLSESASLCRTEVNPRAGSFFSPSPSLLFLVPWTVQIVNSVTQIMTTITIIMRVRSWMRYAVLPQQQNDE